MPEAVIAAGSTAAELAAASVWLAGSAATAAEAAVYTGWALAYSVAAGGIAQSLLITAGVAALNYALAPKMNQGSAVGGEPPSTMIRQPAAAAPVCLGVVLSTGKPFFIEVKPPWLYIGIVLSVGEIEGVSRVKINNQWVSFDPVTHACVDEPYNSSGSVHFYASFLPGTMDQGVDPILAADFSDLSADFRTPGFATVVFKMERLADEDTHRSLWGSAIPNPLCEVYGIKAYDPRDPAQDPDDSTTWLHTRNPALLIGWYMNWRFGNNVPWERMDLDSFRTAASTCDNYIGTPDGSEPIFQCDGVITADAEPFQVLTNLLTSCIGSIGLTGSVEHIYQIRCGAYPEPIRTLRDGDLRGGVEFGLLRETADLINTVRTRFAPAERDYQLDTGPVTESAAYIAADGQVNEATLDLPFTSSHWSAQRIAKRAMEESRAGKTLRGVYSLGASFKLTEYDVVNAPHSLFPATDGVRFQVKKIMFDEQFMSMNIDMAEVNPAALDFIAALAPDGDYMPFELEVDELEGVN